MNPLCHGRSTTSGLPWTTLPFFVAYPALKRWAFGLFVAHSRAGRPRHIPSVVVNSAMQKVGQPHFELVPKSK